MAVGDLIIPEGFGNAVLSYQVSGRSNPITVGLGYSPESSVDPTAHANAIMTAMTLVGTPSAAARMTHDFTFVGVTCTYNDAGTMVGGASTEPAVTGTQVTDDFMIVNSTWLVQKRTGLVGKHYRGRFYFPFMDGSEGNANGNGVVNNALVVLMQSYWNTFFTALGDGTPVIIPNLLHHEPAVGTAPVPTPISSFLVKSKLATQRRRLR